MTDTIAITAGQLRRKDVTPKLDALALEVACQLIATEYGGDAPTAYIAYVEDRARQAIVEALDGLDFDTRAEYCADLDFEAA